MQGIGTTSLDLSMYVCMYVHAFYSLWHDDTGSSAPGWERELSASDQKL